MPKYSVVQKWDVYEAWSLFPNFVYKSINFMMGSNLKRNLVVVLQIVTLQDP